MKEGDYIEHLHVCSTHDYLLFFTNKGKVYRLKVYELPEGARTSKGRALINLLPLTEGEKVVALIPTRDFSEGKYLVFGTRKGMVKKTLFKDYDTNIKAAGLIAINIKKGDDLIQVRQTSGKDDVIMVSKSGKAVRFSEKDARPMGRGTAGVKGMNVAQKGNEVLALEVARNEDELFVVTENGYGKRTPMPEYPVKGRGTQGVLTIKLTEKKGGLAGAMIVRGHQELVFISQTGMVQRNAVEGISQMGRSTQGVRVMNLKSKDRVSAVALVVENGNGDSGAKVDEVDEGAEGAQKSLAEEEKAAEEAAAEEVKVAKKTARSSAAAPKAAAKPKAASKPKPAAKPKAKAKPAAKVPKKPPKKKKPAVKKPAATGPKPKKPPKKKK